MKKFTAILLTVIMVASLFISCNNSIAPTVTDETVSVSFSEATSRDLAASLEPFYKNTLYWKYAAKKNDADGTGLNSGATVSYNESDALWIYGGSADTPTDKGLGSVANFSQGIWDFKLFAYKQETVTNASTSTTSVVYKLAYQGEVTGVSLKKGSANTVNVTVSPVAVAGKKGTLVLDDENIKLAPAKDGNTYTNLTKVYTVTRLGDTAKISPDNGTTNYKWTLDAGTYKVNVDFVKNGYTYASGSVVATVYSNIQTEVSGNIPELVTKAEFDSSLNPDIMNKEASSTSFDLGTLTKTDAADVTLTESSSKVDATVPAAAAAQIIKTVAGNEAPANTTVKLALRVDTVSATNTTLDLEIGMQATVTKTEDNKITQTTHKVTELKDSSGASVISTVTIKLQPKLKNVVVKHDSKDMQNLGDLSEAITNVNGAYYYNAEDGLLTIKTSSFSPFTVTYDAPDYVAKVGEKKYASLGGALNGAANGSTVVVLKDVSGPITVNSGKNITLDLNGYSITADGTAIKNNGTLTIKDSGTNGKVQSNGNVAIAAGDNSVTTIESGTYSGPEGAVITGYATGATINIKGGVFEATDNSVISGNGNKTVGKNGPERKYSNTINITGGTFIGKIKTSGYVACGIYAPWKDNINVSGGTFNITGGAGIVARAGNVIVSGGTFNCTGNATGKVGDSRVVVPCSALVFDSEANYPAMTPESKITVTGGTFTSEVDAIATVPDTAVGRINITGGTFSTDPTNYVGFGYKATENNDKLWTVSAYRATEDDPILIYNAEQFAKISSGSSTNKKHYKLMENIDVSSIKNGNYAISSEIGNIVLDGNNKNITGVNNGYIFELISNSHLKNINIELNGKESAISEEARYNMQYDSVNLSGEINVTGNCGAYTIYAYKPNFTFNNCVSKVDISGTSYNTIFVGYVYTGASYTPKLVFNKCRNEGRIVCNDASMFIANPNAYNIICNVTDCENKGLVQSTNTNNTLNYYYSVTSNCYGAFKINDTVYNDIADGRSSAPSCFDDTTVKTSGQAIQGPLNTGLSITENEDKTFSITEATIDGKKAHHYTVYVGVYAALKEGGSRRNYATETITINAGENSKTTNLKNLSFVDTQWLEDHEGEVEGNLAGNTIYTLNGESYYMLKYPDTDTLNGNAKAPQMIYVVAFDAENKTLASAQLIGSIS